ncbi:MFS transporter [Candidatus Saccharibacteria bacterium]|nr:MFS transporter [Candidatus Saccharibacteria bacterium]
MKKWSVVVILAFAQFVMVLDSTVMNVSITTVAKDLGTDLTSMQGAITFYTLTMAAFMLVGAKLGDKWGRKRTFIVGSVIYALGSLITAVSQNFQMLFVGWSIIEGLGAIMVIPAIAALTASNYKGKDLVKAFAIIWGVAGAAAAAGPLIGGFVTTYLSWRYVFVAEVFIMAGVLIFNKRIADKSKTLNEKLDMPSILLSSVGLVMIVFAMLQSKTWGWVEPRAVPMIGDIAIKPFGVSIVAYMLIFGVLIMNIFYNRQVQLESNRRNPLVRVSMLSIPQLRAGLAVLMSQYIVIGSVFFIVPVYLQTTLGYDALQTGIKILPLSAALVIFSILGARLSEKFSPKNIIKFGQLLLVVGVLSLLASIDTNLNSKFFWIGMVLLGSGIGTMSSQLGNVNMSAVTKDKSSEVGGLQGVFQNLGSSFGTALIGSILVGVLTTTFVANIQASNLPYTVKNYVEINTKSGVAIVSAEQVDEYAISQGLSEDEAATAADSYASSQVVALRNSVFILFVITALSSIFSRNLPNKVLK